jgi:hypothetical protein
MWIELFLAVTLSLGVPDAELSPRCAKAIIQISKQLDNAHVKCYDKKNDFEVQVLYLWDLDRGFSFFLDHELKRVRVVRHGRGALIQVREAARTQGTKK